VFYAHSTERQDRSDWQRLKEHLECVAASARENAAKFNAAELGYVAGLLHDLGKYSQEFQNRLSGDPARVDHSTAGALVAFEKWNRLAKPIAFGIAGHHAGLANGAESLSITSLCNRLSCSLGREIPALDPSWTDEIALPDKLTVPRFETRDAARTGFQLAFFTRMLFSCLVDADFLDTERFYNNVAGREPLRGSHPPMEALGHELNAYLADKIATAANEASEANRRLNERRAEILAHVRAMATRKPGVFSLTVPTGGGKTLTSLAFALDHALEHRLNRIIYVIPFTSIVEQTAQVFREALSPLGEDAVLEHHSAFDDESILRRFRERGEAEQGPTAQNKLRLAMENWDAPVVVTTAVQFFESLFANRPSRCRKLHNIARSVVILDEAQKLPLPVLRPCVAALDELARNYGTTIVLCTATQPAIVEHSENPERSFKGGLQKVRELAPEPAKLYEAFQRVNVVREPNPLEDQTLAERLKAEQQVLCIVNSRAHARALYDAIKEGDGARHLTTLMCAKHRSQVLSEIKQDLKNERPCRLVATSLIEAGVDVDFPTVYRAEAGIDSIAQAAGRCNRENRYLPKDSRVVVFAPPQWPAPVEVKQFAAVGRSVVRRYDDPLSLEAVEAYFRELYWLRNQGSQSELDAKQILTRLHDRAPTLDFEFESIANDFRMIEDFMVPIIMPWDDTAERNLSDLEHAERVGGIARKLQPYIVQVPPKARAQLMSVGAVSAIQPERFGEQFVRLDNVDLYDPKVGLHWDDPRSREPDSLVI